MRARQREPRVAVIELSRRPRRGIVAHSAFLRKSGNNMIGILGAAVIRQVARHTRSRQRRILPVAVTGGTQLACVRPCKRELGAAVTGFCVGPRCH